MRINLFICAHMYSLAQIAAANNPLPCTNTGSASLARNVVHFSSDKLNCFPKYSTCGFLLTSTTCDLLIISYIYRSLN